MATKSTHYKLNLVEGSDKVNPLIYDVPNYTAIDAAMYENATATIGTATELKNGSVHAITVADTNKKTFIFTATSDFTAGETFTVNGVQVSAYTTNSQPLGTNAYRIGTSVLAHLEDTILTLYVSRSTSAKAEDSEKLDGQPASYYATAQAVTDAKAVADASTVIANNAVAKADTVESALNARQNITMSVTDGVLYITY